MMKKIKNGFISTDFFGHPIQLNFNKKGNTHNTFLGACVSLFVSAFLVFYFYIHLERMIFYKNDTISSYTETIQLEDMKPVNYQDMNIMTSFILLNGTHMIPKDYDDDAKRYLSVQYSQTYWDYSVNPPIIPTRKTVKVRSCDKDLDMGRTK